MPESNVLMVGYIARLPACLPACIGEEMGLGEDKGGDTPAAAQPRSSSGGSSSSSGRHGGRRALLAARALLPSPGCLTKPGRSTAGPKGPACSSPSPHCPRPARLAVRALQRFCSTRAPGLRHWERALQRERRWSGAPLPAALQVVFMCIKRPGSDHTMGWKAGGLAACSRSTTQHRQHFSRAPGARTTLIPTCHDIIACRRRPDVPIPRAARLVRTPAHSAAAPHTSSAPSPRTSPQAERSPLPRAASALQGLAQCSAGAHSSAR